LALFDRVADVLKRFLEKEGRLPSPRQGMKGSEGTKGAGVSDTDKSSQR
jgi:hypothetical protein